MSQLIDGKALADEIVQQVAVDVISFRQRFGTVPGLAVVLVGSDPASHVYVRNKVKRAKEAGLNSMEFKLDSDCSQQTLMDLIDVLNQDPEVHGILVQLPLPPQLNEDAVLMAISPEKDVDGFHPMNVGRLMIGKSSLLPCTPMGCMEMLRRVHDDLSGLHAVVVGRSNIVGKPMAALLLQASCTVTIVHSRTADIREICSQADIVVAAVGRAGLVKADWIKPGATVIDVGINAVEVEGVRKLCGDVDFAAVAPIAGAITPVPGGVGPMTIACLMRNTLTAATALLSQLEEKTHAA